MIYRETSWDPPTGPPEDRPPSPKRQKKSQSRVCICLFFLLFVLSDAQILSNLVLCYLVIILSLTREPTRVLHDEIDIAILKIIYLPLTTKSIILQRLFPYFVSGLTCENSCCRHNTQKWSAHTTIDVFFVIARGRNAKS